MKSDESEDESEEKKSFSEKGESSEDVSRGKAVKDHLSSNENSEHEEEETDDEVENSDELALDDIGESSSTKNPCDCESGSLTLVDKEIACTRNYTLQKCGTRFNVFNHWLFRYQGNITGTAISTRFTAQCNHANSKVQSQRV